MSKKREQLLAEVAKLQEATEALREVLARYKQANSYLAIRVEQGESIFEAFDSMDGPMRYQQELTAIIREFEAARHKVRLALFSLAVGQGATFSELGRRLGISRQLASRLAAEARVGEA